MRFIARPAAAQVPRVGDLVACSHCDRISVHARRLALCGHCRRRVHVVERRTTSRRVPVAPLALRRAPA